MYNQNDMQEARRSLNRCCGLLALIVVPLLAGYVWSIVKGRQDLMLAALLTGFVCVVLICDLVLLPVLRYVRFLKEMGKGLRRSVDCVIGNMDPEEQIQDGIRVRVLYVYLDRNGDSRIFYVNVSKAEFLPAADTWVRLTTYGRHVVDCEVL